VQIAGAGPLRDQLADQVERLDLGGTVDLLGPLPQDRVRELVADADVFAAPCRVGVDGNRDGLPTVLLEAMALGTPCVSTPVTGIPEVVRDQETGLLVPEDDPSALAAALGSLIADADLRARLAAAARALIVDEFDARRQSALVGELFTTEAAA
jgi:glycosyltransferase involved in cell wall biosynthesis